MPLHSDHMIRFVLLLLCLGIAGLSPVFAEEGTAPSGHGKQERVDSLTVVWNGMYSQLDNGITLFMGRHRDAPAFRMRPQFQEESFYWNYLPARFFLLRGRIRTVPAECRKIPGTPSFRSFRSSVERGRPALFNQRARNRECKKSSSRKKGKRNNA